MAHQLHFPINKMQDRIDEKNQRYEEYLKNCDKCWLLIVVNIFKNSQSFDIHDRVDHKFESKFERVFILDASHRKELKELSIVKV